MTEALRRCLALEDDEVVGCVAQLATVSDGALARLLSASYRGMMPLLVTKTPAAQKRVTRHLAQHKVRISLPARGHHRSLNDAGGSAVHPLCKHLNRLASVLGH